MLGGDAQTDMLAETAVSFCGSEGHSMKALTRLAFPGLMLGSMLLAPALAHAQGGCVSSPECPTAVLGVVGAAGAALYVRWRSR